MKSKVTIKEIYRKLKQEAVPLGLELIELERELNNGE
jgi:hypothetical protein